MTFGHCIACTNISLVIFTVDVNVSRRYPQDILFYLGPLTCVSFFASGTCFSGNFLLISIPFVNFHYILLPYAEVYKFNPICRHEFIQNKVGDMVLLPLEQSKQKVIIS
jgi:hypothetical protein